MENSNFSISLRLIQAVFSFPNEHKILTPSTTVSLLCFYRHQFLGWLGKGLKGQSTSSLGADCFEAACPLTIGHTELANTAFISFFFVGFIDILPKISFNYSIIYDFLGNSFPLLY